MSKHWTAKDWAAALDLEPHPEGGYFREVYRADLALPAEALPERYDGSRSAGTSIYFLLGPGDLSHFHRLKSDEIWHFYQGAGMIIHLLGREGHRTIRLGPGVDHGEQLQALIPAGVWFAAEAADPEGFCLIGCTVCPGFDFTDFELAEREQLLRQFPQQDELIRRFT